MPDKKEPNFPGCNTLVVAVKHTVTLRKISRNETIEDQPTIEYFEGVRLGILRVLAGQLETLDQLFNFNLQMSETLI